MYEDTSRHTYSYSGYSPYFTSSYSSSATATPPKAEPVTHYDVKYIDNAGHMGKCM